MEKSKVNLPPKQTFRTSYSALETFRQCPQKYKFQVIDKIKAPKLKEAVFGSIIHKTLKFFHSKSSIPPTLDEFLNYYKDIWPAFSIDKEPKLFQSQEEDMIYFAEGIKILKNYYQYFLKNQSKSIILNTEVRFEILLEKPFPMLEAQPPTSEKNCVLVGIIDRIDKTKDGIEIIDYKTAKRLPIQRDVDNNLQLSLYCLGLIKSWPQFAKRGLENIKLTFHYLKHQETISTKRTWEQLENVKKQVWERIAEIEKDDFKPIPSNLCDWCGYKNICPMWKHKYSEQKTVDDEQINKIIKEFLELKEQNQINNKRLTELKELINNYLNQEKIERVFNKMGYITRLSQVHYKYDINKIKEILKPLGRWEDVLTINTEKLKKLIKTLPYSTRKHIEKAKEIKKEYTILKTSIKKNNNAHS